MRNFAKAKTCIAIFSLGAALCAPAAMAFGLGDLVGGGKPAAASSASAGDPDAFLKLALDAEKLMNNSLALMVTSLVSKDKQAALADQKMAANAITDDKEKEAKQAEWHKSELAAIQEATSNKQFDADVNNLDAKKKAELGASAFNFMLALLKDKDLVGQVSGLISSLSSNPMNLFKVGSIKDASVSLSNQMSDASQVAGKMPDIFKAVQVTAPTSASEKAKDVESTKEE